MDFKSPFSRGQNFNSLKGHFAWFYPYLLDLCSFCLKVLNFFPSVVGRQAESLKTWPENRWLAEAGKSSGSLWSHAAPPEPPRAGCPAPHPGSSCTSPRTRAHGFWVLVPGCITCKAARCSGEPPVLQFVPTVSPGTGHHWQQPGSVLSSSHSPFRCLWTLMRCLWASSSPDGTVPALSASTHRRRVPVCWSSQWPHVGLLPECPSLLYWVAQDWT